MRDFISFYLNGEKTEVRGQDAFLTLSDYLRKRRGLTGTKIVCSEGDCGACTVLCGYPRHDDTEPLNGNPDGNNQVAPQPVSQFDYRSIDSCIRFIFQLDGVHIVTVEGLNHDSESLNGVQEAMIECHGSQCGFCTPGFVMAMTGMFQEARQFDVDEIRYALTGNLCRCTGYTPIIEAALATDIGNGLDLNKRYPANTIKPCERSGDPILIKLDQQELGKDNTSVYCPATVEQAVHFLMENPSARIVAGATDLGVLHNKNRLEDQVFVDLNRIRLLQEASYTNGAIVAGSMTTWHELEELTKHNIPQFSEIISIFGSPQIRHVGTLGGNLMNASPIADSIPFLMIADARLTLTGASGDRKVSINQFYTGYKQFDLRVGELLTQIEIPIPSQLEKMRLFKISRRRDMDIATFTAGIHIQTKQDQITSARIAFGAVAPTVIRLNETESFLEGRRFDIDSMKQASVIAIQEVSPISDVRGSADYRLQLAGNILLKYFHDLQTKTTVTSQSDKG